jgi:general secretion pathway protein C
MNKAQITMYWQELPWNEIKLKAIKILPKFVFIVLIILLAQTFAKLTWNLFIPAQKMVSTNSKKHAVAAKTVAANADLNKVGTYHLFGNAKAQVQQKVIDAPETRLRLDLKGVFASTNASKALAIISSSKGKDKTYQIGDKVIGGALLHAVYSDRVILKRNGKLETLRLPKSKVDSKSFYSSESDSKLAKVKPLTLNKLSTLTGAQNNSNKGQTQRLRKIRDTLLKDPEKVWQQVRINPVMKNGKIQGYTLAHNDQGLMKALNIRKTDIITGINGQSLSDPATLYGLMNSLSKEKSLQVAIERNGQQQTVQLNF